MADLRTRLVRATTWSLLGLAVQACGLPQPVVPGPVSDPCVIVDDEPRDIRVALSGSERDTGTPERTPAVRWLATQLFRTLVELDCTGAVHPGLATSWSDSAGVIWEFTIRRAAQAPLDAGAVLRSWSEAPMARSLFADLRAEGAHRLRVELREPGRIHLFADPALGISGSAGATRGWDLIPGDPPVLRSGSRTLELHSYRGDLRTAIENGMDALVTADPDVIAYGARAGYAAVPLPWSQTYVLATGGVREGARLPDEIAASLARDVVGRDARPAPPPFWWEPPPCGLAGVRFRTHDEARDIVYPRADRAAQALAERIAALAWPVTAAPPWLRELLPAAYGAGGAPRAVPLDDDALLRAVRARLPLAVVAPLPRVHDLECSAAGATVPSALLRAGWQVTALADARDVLLHRPGVGRITVNGSGTIRFVAP